MGEVQKGWLVEEREILISIEQNGGMGSLQWSGQCALSGCGHRTFN